MFLKIVDLTLGAEWSVCQSTQRVYLLQPMKQFATNLAILFLAPFALVPAPAQSQTAVSAQVKLIVKQDVPYAEPADPRQKVDIYGPEGAKNLPVVFWIHGGGWQAGDRTNVQVKPQAFV